MERIAGANRKKAIIFNNGPGLNVDRDDERLQGSLSSSIADLETQRLKIFNKYQLEDNRA
jgi:hypothetical protein